MSLIPLLESIRQTIMNCIPQHCLAPSELRVLQAETRSTHIYRLQTETARETGRDRESDRERERGGQLLLHDDALQ